MHERVEHVITHHVSDSQCTAVTQQALQTCCFW